MSVKSENDDLLKLFQRPSEWRQYCESLDANYHEDVVDSNSISMNSEYCLTMKGKERELSGSKNNIEVLDRLTGFTPILREYSKTASRSHNESEIINTDELRNIYLQKNPSRKIRILSYKSDIVGIDHASREIMKPTIISTWLSLMAKQRDLIVENSFDRKFFNPCRVAMTLSQHSDLGIDFDTIKYKVGMNYNPSALYKLNVHSFIERVVCSNGSMVVDRNHPLSVPYSHDNGALRNKLEQIISNQLREREQIKHWIEDLNDLKIADLKIHLLQWKFWSKISKEMKEAIEAEYIEHNENQSCYDLFNAITAARNRINFMSVDAAHQELAVIAGKYLADNVIVTNARSKLNLLLNGVV